MKSQNRRPPPPTATYLPVVALLTVCFLLSGLTGYAQLSSAAVNGTIRDATGVSFTSIPLLPEDLFLQLAMRESQVEAAPV